LSFSPITPCKNLHSPSPVKPDIQEIGKIFSPAGTIPHRFPVQEGSISFRISRFIRFLLNFFLFRKIVGLGIYLTGS
jgi:hypothetical protein